ncbi:MAG: hypothetical protein K2M03_06750, partial [Muribaculaceae bacterium]|nr:hypothetical protein [Muribaculaceae bacterium]
MILSVFIAILILFMPVSISAESNIYTDTVIHTDTVSAKVTTLDEVVVSRKRNKYSKRNNHAYELMTKISDHKDDNNPRNQ